MANTRYRSTGYYSSFFPAGVKWLLISNVGIFLLYFFAAQTTLGQHFSVLALSPRGVLEHFAIWQLVTYMFLHSPQDLAHILFNMLSLYFFGSALERTWGTRRFLTFYFVCGIGAAICDITANVITGTLDVRTIGASGAVYGLLLAFGVLFPNTTIIFFIFPIKAKYLVMILGGMEFLNSFRVNTGVSSIAHLGGMLTAYLFLRARIGGVEFTGLRQRYAQWKMDRAKKKFQVYLRKHGSDRDRWVN